MLYEAFFQLAGNLEDMRAQRKTQVTGAQLAQVDRDFATVFRINASELDKLFGLTRAANTEIRAIDAEMRTHANARARLELFPDPAVTASECHTGESDEVAGYIIGRRLGLGLQLHQHGCSKFSYVGQSRGEETVRHASYFLAAAVALAFEPAFCQLPYAIFRTIQHRYALASNLRLRL